MIDDVNLKDIDPSYWRRQIGTVGQVNFDEELISS